MKARATPSPTSKAKIGRTLALPLQVNTINPGADHGLERKAQRHDGAPVVTVGNRAGNEDKQQRRQELHQPDDAEIERVAGHVIDLPADRDRHDLSGEAHHEASLPIEQETAVAEGGTF